MNVENLLVNYTKKNEELKWSGTFKEYLELVRKNPNIAKSSHTRVYDMIMEKGFTEENGIKKYHFFEEELYGLESVAQTLVEEYFKPAAMGLDVKKRMLLMMGPVSSGKSTIATMIKRGLESYSKTDNGAMYAIKGCPMNSEPLWMIPIDLRPQFEEELGVNITGELNPRTKQMIEEEYVGDFLHVPVERIFLSEQNRIGIGTFSPSDPKSQDISDLIGSIDFSKIQEYGTESDPRAYSFDGEFNIANRGVMEFQEVLKCDEKFLWHLLSLTQEGNFKAGRFALIDADELILAHTNETEYRSFIANDKNEALRSRMIVVHVPYNMNATQEENVLVKSLEKNEINMSIFAPFAIRSLAEFVVMTRLVKDERIPAFDKMMVLDGKSTKKYKVEELSEYVKEEEGMFGIDLRYVINRISYLVANRTEAIDGFELLMEIEKGFHQHPSIKKDKIQEYKALLSDVRAELSNKMKEDVKTLWFNDREAQNMFDNYVQNATLFLSNETGDEEFMRNLETGIGVSERSKKAFREEISIRSAAYARKGKEFRYDSHEELKEAISKRMVRSLKEVIEISEEKLKEISNTYAELKNIHFNTAYKIVKIATDAIVKTA